MVYHEDIEKKQLYYIGWIEGKSRDSAFKESHVKTSPKGCHSDAFQYKIRIISYRKNPIHSTFGEFNSKSETPEGKKLFFFFLIISLTFGFALGVPTILWLRKYPQYLMLVMQTKGKVSTQKVRGS